MLNTGWLQDGGLALLDQHGLCASTCASVTGRGRLAGGLGEHREDRIQVVGIGGLVERDRQPVIGIAEIDLRRFGQRVDLDVVGVR